MELPLIVVPCFNEEKRLDLPQLKGLADSGRIHLLFVNDGSTDGTGRLLAELSETSDAIATLDLSVNVGKAEAIRLGLLRCIDLDATITGYYDADLATPPTELGNAP